MMFSREMGRRKFIQNMSSAFLGVVTGRFWGGNLSFAKTEKTPTLEYRTLGKTGMKVTVVSMGVMNCTDPSVIHRAFDLGINFFDTAPTYTRGTNEEMVGPVLKAKRDKVFIQTKVRVQEEKQMRASVERSLRRLQTDYVDVLVWHGLHSTKEILDSEL